MNNIRKKQDITQEKKEMADMLNRMQVRSTVENNVLYRMRV
jgi:hypothetical protein